MMPSTTKMSRRICLVTKKIINMRKKRNPLIVPELIINSPGFWGFGEIGRAHV